MRTRPTMDDSKTQQRSVARFMDLSTNFAATSLLWWMKAENHFSVDFYIIE